MLKGMHIVVTGASRGIGRAIAREAARHGARVGLNYLRGEDAARELRDELVAGGAPEPVLLPFDATRRDAIEGGIARFLEACPRLDGLVNNAARNLPGLLPMLTDEEVREQLDSALAGPILCCQAVLPHMLAERGGSIVNIGSVVTERAFRGQSVYAAAKGGVAAFTRALAFEVARKGIRVNCVQPGPVQTDMFRQTDGLLPADFLARLPQGKPVDAADVAATVVFLLSSQAASTTGCVLNVDGGYAL